ncbi:MAG: adenylate/guanylate cyclase domain-containing protein [Burkholderiales bacterium]
MAESSARRKLAAILSADAVGYSRLMAANEAATVETLKQYRAIIGQIVERHAGRVVNAPGDSLLAEFPSAVEAVHAAVEIQKSLEGRNVELGSERAMQFRIGVNLGDVIEESDGTIYGDGVNIAARMEALAEAGGICISSTVFDAVEGKLSFGFDFLGEQQVKNIPKAVKVYRVRADARPPSSALRRPRVDSRVVAAGLIILIVGGGGLWFYRHTMLPTPRQAATDDPVLALPKGPSIAVLPFTNISGDATQEYFSDGLTEDLITGLSRFPDLLVIGRNTTFQYKGKAVDIRTLGRDVGARYVVEGSVRRGTKTVRVTAQLLDARDGKHLWAETFDRDLTVGELFSVQDEITAQIIGAIAGSYGAISRTRRDAAVAAGTANLEAYDCVLQAYAYENLLTPEVHAATRDCLERAVKLDPRYAAAWSKLAFLYADEYAFGYNVRPRSLDRALEAAQRAVELDPSSGTAYWHLARTHYWRNEVEEALAAAERALALSPNNAFILAAAGTYMAPTSTENLKRGMQLASKALHIDPNAPGWYHVPEILYYYSKREYDSALAASLKMNMPKFFHTYVWRTAIYGQLGRTAEAASSREKLLQLYPTYAENVRQELKKFNLNAALAEHVIDGLRKGGLQIAPETH